MQKLGMLLGTEPRLGLRTHSRLEAPDLTRLDADPGGGRGTIHEEVHGIDLCFQPTLVAPQLVPVSGLEPVSIFL